MWDKSFSWFTRIWCKFNIFRTSKYWSTIRNMVQKMIAFCYILQDSDKKIYLEEIRCLRIWNERLKFRLTFSNFDLWFECGLFFLFNCCHETLNLYIATFKLYLKHVNFPKVFRSAILSLISFSCGSNA